MYNHTMKRESSRKRLSMGLLILGMAFLTLGLATDQPVFTWASIVFVLVSLVMGGKWLGKR
jgi:hypothetical protein